MIEWPRGYGPEETAVHARTELEMMDVSAEDVWLWLVRAELWSTWYPDFQNVVIQGGGPDLKLGTKFRWKAFGVTLDSKIEEFIQFERIAWTAEATGIDAYHATLIVRRPSGCRVLTEENQNGWVARLSNVLRPKLMGKIQKDWLLGLFEKAKGGPPPLLSIPMQGRIQSSGSTSPYSRPDSPRNDAQHRRQESSADQEQYD